MKFKNILEGVAFAILAFVFLAALLLEGRKSADFLEKIEQKFELGADDISLHETTDFPWEKVCFFNPVNEPESAYWAYEEYIEKEFPKHNLLKRGNYFMIFIFQQGNNLREFAFKQSHLRINKSKFWLRIVGEEMESTGGCLKKDAFLKKKDSAVIEIYRGK